MIARRVRIWEAWLAQEHKNMAAIARQEHVTRECVRLIIRARLAEQQSVVSQEVPQ